LSFCSNYMVVDATKTLLTKQEAADLELPTAFPDVLIISNGSEA